MEARPTWRNFFVSFAGMTIVWLIVHHKGLRSEEWLSTLLAALAEGLMWSSLIVLGLLAHSRDKKSKRIPDSFETPDGDNRRT